MPAAASVMAEKLSKSLKRKASRELDSASKARQPPQPQPQPQSQDQQQGQQELLPASPPYSQFGRNVSDNVNSVADTGLTPSTTPTEEWTQTILQIQRYDPRIAIPRGLDPAQPMDAEILRHIAALRDRHAVRLFIRVIQTTRQGGPKPLVFKPAASTPPPPEAATANINTKNTAFTPTTIPLTPALLALPHGIRTLALQLATISRTHQNTTTTDHLTARCYSYTVGKIYTQLARDSRRIAPELKALVVRTCGTNDTHFEHAKAAGVALLRFACPTLGEVKTHGPHAVARACVLEGLVPFLFKDKRWNVFGSSAVQVTGMAQEALARFHAVLGQGDVCAVGPEGGDYANFTGGAHRYHSEEDAEAEREYIAKLCVAGCAFISTLTIHDVYFAWEDDPWLVAHGVDLEDVAEYPARLCYR